MKAFVIVWAVLVPTALQAASPEQDYAAARDRAIQQIEAADKAGTPSDRVVEMQDRAVADLEKLLQRIVGPSSLNGVEATATNNVDTLIRGDLGFGRLDGLAYASADNKTRIVVSTDTLFKAWLKSRRKWWPNDDVPQDIDKALRSEVFFTQALQGDAAFQRYAVLPVKKPPQAGAVFAMLDTRAQDIGPWPANEITATLIRGHRVYVVTTPASVDLALMPECVKQWDAANKTLEDASATPTPGQSFGDLSERIRSGGDVAFHRCFAERAPRAPGYAALVRQAQDILDGLPSGEPK
jgi:hypothetical protein